MKFLILIVLIKTAAVAAFIVNGNVGLGPDEAQYWTWSHLLDWGYYSKPPGIAWQIAVGTWLFGDTELGVRFGSLIIGALLPLAVFRLGKSCKLMPSTCMWAGIIMALCPLGLLSSLLAITDGGIVLFWTLACITLCSYPSMLLIGACVLCGALFKWQIYYFWLFVILFKNHLPNFRWINYFGGVLVSLIGLAPSLIWNVNHGWATFRHVGGNLAVNAPAQGIQGNFWGFLGEQAILLSPIIFLILIASLVYLMRKCKEVDWPVWFCGMSTLIILSTHLLLSIVKKLQGNWCDYVYPGAIVFLCWYACEKTAWGKKGLAAGIALSLSLLFIPLPYRMSPIKHNLGWHNLARHLKAAGYDPQHHFLFGDKYQMSSILSFYSEGQKRAYFLNLRHIRHNQFSFWPSMADEQKGETGYFVVTENYPHMEKNFPIWIKEYQEMLQKYFKEVHYLGEVPLYEERGVVLKAALIFKGVDYNGIEPSPTDLW